MTTRRPTLTAPPKEYDPGYFVRLLSQLNNYFVTVDNPGDAVYNTLRLLNPPVSGYGLPYGAVWSDNGALKIVSSNFVYVQSVFGTGEVGTVTVVV